MPQVTMVGLGPGDAALITREAWEVLRTAREVWLRTAHHPCARALPQGPTVHSFDAVYERVASFEELYHAIATELLRLAQRPEGVVYAVPGDPLVGDATVTETLRMAAAQGVPVRLVHGLSFIEPVLGELGRDALDGLQLLDAVELAQVLHPPLNPDVPALVAYLGDRALASEVKLALMNQYPDEHPVKVVEGVGLPAQRVTELALYELDQRDFDAFAVLYVPALPPVSSFEGFQQTIARLRAPNGCPWDREQTHQSLRPNLLEEAYEVLEALDKDDPEALREELGDLLLQIVLHAQIATEGGEFQMPEVIAGIDAKIKRRHPHVWGTTQVNGAAEVSQNWERIKKQERAQHGEEGRSLLDGVPRTLPALAQAQDYGTRAARVGFDWPDVQGVIEKVREELRELEAAQTPEERAHEVGDVLFTVVNWARWLGVDAESALRAANRRFAERFAYLEAQARQRGKTVETMAPEALDALWNEAKAQRR